MERNNLKKVVEQNSVLVRARAFRDAEKESRLIGVLSVLANAKPSNSWVAGLTFPFEERSDSEIVVHTSPEEAYFYGRIRSPYDRRNRFSGRSVDKKLEVLFRSENLPLGIGERINQYWDRFRSFKDLKRPYLGTEWEVSESYFKIPFKEMIGGFLAPSSKRLLDHIFEVVEKKKELILKRMTSIKNNESDTNPTNVGYRSRFYRSLEEFSRSVIEGAISSGEVYQSSVRTSNGKVLGEIDSLEPRVLFSPAVKTSPYQK